METSKHLQRAEAYRGDYMELHAKKKKFTRRDFLRLGSYSLVPYGLAFMDGFFIERQWLKIQHLVLSKKPTCRIVHFTDVHHKGDIPYFEKVISKINSFQPDFVCFTGDLIEDKAYLDEALRCLQKIKYPLFGVPGNHDYWSNASFADIKTCFQQTGGDWLLDEEVLSPDGKVALTGSTGLGRKLPPRTKNNNITKRILLDHYPASADKVEGSYDLILSGHSHGGQVRLPFYGAITVPYGVGEYDRGLFQTPAGPLFVNAGIGYLLLPIRFFCRPELALIEI
jgi:predicted MPP superfamily phosphohydrolase